MRMASRLRRSTITAETRARGMTSSVIALGPALRPRWSLRLGGAHLRSGHRATGDRSAAKDRPDIGRPVASNTRKHSLIARYSPWSAEPMRVWDCL